MRVKSDDLLLLVAIAEEGHFRRAAVKLGLTPSGLSHALRSLETRLGVCLVIRTTRSVRLSDIGSTLVERVRPALAAIESAVAEAREESPTVSGRIRITATEHGAKLLLQRGLSEFQLLHPEVDVEVTVETAQIDLVREGYDAGVRFHDDVPPDMTAVQLSPRASFAVVASPRYLSTRPVPLCPQDLLEHRCVRQRFASGVIYRWEFNIAGREVTIVPQSGLTSNNVAVIVAAILKDAGFGYVPQYHVESAICSGALIKVLAGYMPEMSGHSFYYPRSQQQTRALTALVQLLRRSCAGEA